MILYLGLKILKNITFFGTMVYFSTCEVISLITIYSVYLSKNHKPVLNPKIPSVILKMLISNVYNKANDLLIIYVP